MSGKADSLEQRLLGGRADSDTLTEPRSRLAAWGPALLHRHVRSGSRGVLKKRKS